MKHTLLITLTAVISSLVAACQPKSYAPPHSGIQIELSQATDEPLRPGGTLRVEGLDRRLSVHLPVAALDLESQSLRWPLPPGAYAVSYVPGEIDPSLASLRRGTPVKVLSQNPFLVVVPKDRFTTIRVRTVEQEESMTLARE